MSSRRILPAAPPGPPDLSWLVGLTLLLAGATAEGAGALASPWHENPESRVRLITQERVAPRQGEVWLGLHFELAPDWHVYWKNSGDAGFPPEIDVSATPQLADAELLYPAPTRYELPGDLVAYGYGEEVVYPVRATLTAPAVDRVALTVDLGYLVCKIDCVPYQYTLTLDQPVGREPALDPETAPLLARWRDLVPRSADGLAGITTDGALDLADPSRPALVVTVEGVTPPEGARPEIFLEHHALFEPGRPVLEQGARGVRFRIPLEPRRRLAEPPRTGQFAWTVTGLGDPPAIETARTVGARRLTSEGEAPPGAVRRTSAGTDGARHGTLAGLLLRALVGGLALALTPATLALLLAFLGGFLARAAPVPGDTGRHRTLPLGLAAAGGAIACVFALVLLSALVPVDAAGAVGTWSIHLAEPTILTALALLTLLAALWLWGLVGDAERRLAPGGLGTGPAAAAGAFGTLLALPWPVPPGPAALERALDVGLGPPGSGAPLVLVAAAACLGVGLGLPWVLGAVWIDRGADRVDGATDRSRDAPPHETPATRHRLREGLGFLAVLPVFWLLYLLSAHLRTEYLAFIELALLGLALLAWIRHRSRRATVRSALVALLLILSIATVWLADRGRRAAREDAPSEGPRRASVLRARAPSAPGVGMERPTSTARMRY